MPDSLDSPEPSTTAADPGSVGALSRRDLIRLAGIAGIAAGGALAGAARAATSKSLYGAGRILLEIDGQLNLVSSFEGGNVVAELVTAKDVAAGFAKRHVAGLRVEDLVIQTGFALAPALADWLAKSLGPVPVPRNGAIVYCDFSGAVVRRLEFFNALLVEVVTPDCDAAARDVALLTLRLVVDNARSLAGSGQAPGMVPMPAKGASAAAFRLSIAGLEDACKFVSRIEPIATGRTLAPSPGAMREPAGLLTPFTIKPFRLTLAEAQAAPFFNWAESFLVKGNNTDRDERPGLLEWLAPDMKQQVAAADLYNIGILRCAPEPYSAARPGGNVHVDLYAERIGLRLPVA